MTWQHLCRVHVSPLLLHLFISSTFSLAWVLLKVLSCSRKFQALGFWETILILTDTTWIRLNCTFYLVLHKIVMEDVRSKPAHTRTHSHSATFCHHAQQHSSLSLWNLLWWIPSQLNIFAALNMKVRAWADDVLIVVREARGLTSACVGERSK